MTKKQIILSLTMFACSVTLFYVGGKQFFFPPRYFLDHLASSGIMAGVIFVVSICTNNLFPTEYSGYGRIFGMDILDIFKAIGMSLFFFLILVGHYFII